MDLILKHQQKRTHRRLAHVIVVAGWLFTGIGAPSAATAAPPKPQPTLYYTLCSADSSALPHTADGAARWLATCYQVTQLPRTADAAEGWLR